MKKIVYSLQDRLVGYGTPVFVDADGKPDELAMRNVQESLAGVPYDQVIVKAKDLDLVRLGIFDTVTGKFENEPEPEVIASCESLLKKPKGAKNGSKNL